jgi:hypothetical protein
VHVVGFLECAHIRFQLEEFRPGQELFVVGSFCSTTFAMMGDRFVFVLFDKVDYFEPDIDDRLNVGAPFRGDFFLERQEIGINPAHLSSEKKIRFTFFDHIIQ